MKDFRRVRGYKEPPSKAVIKYEVVNLYIIYFPGILITILNFLGKGIMNKWVTLNLVTLLSGGLEHPLPLLKSLYSGISPICKFRKTATVANEN